MTTSVTYAVGDFLFKELYTIGEQGIVLVGEPEQGWIVPKMCLEVAGYSLPIMAVEKYDKTEQYGLLFLSSLIMDKHEVKEALVPGRSFFVVQSIPIAKSHEESTFNKVITSIQELLKTPTS